MTGDKYARLVSRAALRALAEAEGRLRAGAEEREASAERMRADLEAMSLAPEVRERAEREVAGLLSSARAARAEADALRARAPRLAGNVSARPERPTPPAPPTLEDVVFTLERAAGGGVGDASPTTPGASAFVDARDLLRRIPGATPASVRPDLAARARALLNLVAWPPGEPSALAQRALAELDGAVARLP